MASTGSPGAAPAAAAAVTAATPAVPPTLPLPPPATSVDDVTATPASAAVPTAAATSAASASATSAAAVRVQFKAVGSAPILRKNKFRVDAGESFGTVIAFLRRQLQIGDTDPLCCYLASAFAPAATQPLRALADAFAVEGELVVSYSLTPAYG